METEGFVDDGVEVGTALELDLVVKVDAVKLVE